MPSLTIALPSAGLGRRRNEEKRRLLGLRPAGSRPSAAPERVTILPPGIPTLSRLRRRAFVDLGYGVTVTPLQPAHHQAQPSKMAFQKSQAEDRKSTRLNSSH